MTEATARLVPRPSPSPAPSTLDLRMMSKEELVELYHRLEPPSFGEMHGEYAASLLDQGNRMMNLLSRFKVHLRGLWLCKAFEPTGSNEGHGYNSFRGPQGVFRASRMRTRIGPSKLAGDDKDAFHLEYADFNDFRRGGLIGAHLHTMFDEVRKVGPGLYLGIGRVGFTEKARARLHPFILEGPVAPFAG
jgi:hypothetical protein